MKNNEDLKNESGILNEKFSELNEAELDHVSGGSGEGKNGCQGGLPVPEVCSGCAFFPQSGPCKCLLSGWTLSG